MASHQMAWTQTLGKRGFLKREPPVDDLFWATTALTGATSWVHMDADGFATAIIPEAGLKYWVVARPHSDPTMRRDLTAINAFRGFEPSEANLDGFEHEAVLLGPRMVL
jgi:hypothetical protein